MVFEVNPVLLWVLESVDNAGCNNRILNSLVCLLFKILCEEGIRLDGRGHAQQFLQQHKFMTVVESNGL